MNEIITTVTDSSAAGDGNRVRVFSRRGKGCAEPAPLIAEALAKLRVESTGSMTKARSDDWMGFSDYEQYVGAHEFAGCIPLTLSLELDGHDLGRELWSARREKLTGHLHKSHEGIPLSEHPMIGDGDI